MSSIKQSILFEGVPLPGAMNDIDHLGMHDNLPGLSDAASLWLLQFTICNGKTCRDSSVNIRRHVSETLGLIEPYRSRLLETVPKHWEGEFNETVVDAWVIGLTTILEMTNGRETCSWIA